MVYQLTSMTYRRRVRLEAAVTADDPHLPSVTSIYPTADWQERETYDMFGVVFDGHPDLTRILMPDDWEGYPQRKDYPLGGVPGRVQGRRDPAAGPAEGLPVSTPSTTTPPHAETTEGRVFTVTGGDWDTVVTGGIDPLHDERIVVNMGPQHPSTHGVLRLVLELEGETVTEARPVVGYLHTGIEKNLEYRNWTQGVTFVTRMDYLAPHVQRDGVLPRRWRSCSASRTRSPSGPPRSAC